MKKKLMRWLMWLSILGVIFICVSIFSLCVGSVNIPPIKILEAIKSKETLEHSIIFHIRLPRVILGFAIGGALSLAGVILQGMFRNPLVEPYTLGISGGAALGVCLNIILKLHTRSVLTLPLCGFLGAILVVMSVYSLSMKRSMLRLRELLLYGVMLSFICSALIVLIMSISRAEDLHGIVFWIMGSLEEPNWFLIKLAVFASIIGLIISYVFCLHLNAFSLGEEEALHLGIDIEKTKEALFILASLLTGICVSIVGIIGFIGLVIPHFMRLLVGSDHRILLISSFLSGASFLIFCDTLARTIISPLELPVGVITGIFGGTIFIYALSKKTSVW